MTYSSIVISAGHSKKVRGAAGNPGLDEVDEARKVTTQLGEELKRRGVKVVTYWDDVSTTQNENLNRIVDFHNAQKRELDCSIHFNAYQQCSKPMGTETLWLTQEALASKVSKAIASVGFINRGAKKRTDLFFLNQTAKPALLLEICFCDSTVDTDLYRKNFNAICSNIADVLGGVDDGDIEPLPEPEPVPEPEGVLFSATGKCSHFGGPSDTGVSPSEGLAFHYSLTADNQHLFLPLQPTGTSGLARRLNAKAVHYVACRWSYDITSKAMLATDQMALVTNVKTGLAQTAYPADWGPNEATGRVADLSPALMRDLGLETDDVVEVIYPYGED